MRMQDYAAHSHLHPGVPLALGSALLFGGVAGPALLMLGLTQTTASNGALLLNLEGLATMAIAWLV
jgi:drug/metabolite transporter (DMT)-like permease